MLLVFSLRRLYCHRHPRGSLHTRRGGVKSFCSISTNHVYHLSREGNQFGFQFSWSIFDKTNVAEATNHVNCSKALFLCDGSELPLSSWQAAVDVLSLFWPCPWQLSNYIVCWKDFLYECFLVSSLSSDRSFRTAWVLIDSCHIVAHSPYIDEKLLMNLCHCLTLHKWHQLMKLSCSDCMSKGSLLSKEYTIYKLNHLNPLFPCILLQWFNMFLFRALRTRGWQKNRLWVLPLKACCCSIHDFDEWRQSLPRRMHGVNLQLKPSMKMMNVGILQG